MIFRFSRYIHIQEVSEYSDSLDIYIYTVGFMILRFSRYTYIQEVSGYSDSLDIHIYSRFQDRWSLL